MKKLFYLVPVGLILAACSSYQAPKTVKARTWDAKTHYAQQTKRAKACVATTKNYTKNSRTIASSSGCGGYTSIIYGGQTYNTGSIQVSNDLNQVSLGLTSNVAANWYIKEVQIYIGTGPIPTNNQGVPAPGQFPYKEEFATLQSGLNYEFALSDLGVDCGGKLNLAVHTVMVKLGSSGEVVQEETGWAYGPYPFNSNRWGWSFDYTICCDSFGGGSGGCTLTQGYWKNHSKYAKNRSQKINWPVSEDTLLCGKTWYNILHTAPKTGDAWTILAHQWIAAKLNVANGASAPNMVDSALNNGGQLLSNHCGGIPQGQRQSALEYSLILDNYNNGIIGPGHCE